MGNEFQIVNYYLELALRRAAVWMVPAAIAFALAAAYVVTLPRSYFSEAVIVVRSQGIPSALVQSTVAGERLQFIEQRVLASSNLVKLVEKFDLFSELRGVLPDSHLARLVRGQISITMRASEPSDQLAGSSVFGIGVTADTPELAADMASEITAMIKQENQRARMARATDATQFLEREVADLTTRVEEFDRQVAEFVSLNENALPSRLTLHMGELRDGQSELADIDAALSEVRTESQLFQGELALAQLQSGSPLDPQQVLLRDLRSELLTRSTVLSSEHPVIRSLKSRVAALETDLVEAQTQSGSQSAAPVDVSPEQALIARRVEAAAQREQELLTRRSTVEARLQDVRQTVADMPSVEGAFTQLQRDHEAAQVNLEDMRNRLNLARVGERLESDQQEDQIQVLETPEAPLFASDTSRRKYLGAALVASLGLGFGCLFLVDSYDPKIRGAFDIEPLMDEGPLLMIPDWRTPAEKRRRAVATGVATAVAVAGVAVFLHYQFSGIESADAGSASRPGAHGTVVAERVRH